MNQEYPKVIYNRELCDVLMRVRGQYTLLRRPSFLPLNVYTVLFADGDVTHTSNVGDAFVVITRRKFSLVWTITDTKP